MRCQYFWVILLSLFSKLLGGPMHDEPGYFHWWDVMGWKGRITSVWWWTSSFHPSIIKAYSFSLSTLDIPFDRELLVSVAADLRYGKAS